MDSTLLVKAAISALSSVAIKDTYEGVKSIIRENIDRTTLLSTEKKLEENIIEEIRKTSNWAYDDLFKNHKEHSDIISRYVHLDLLLEPRREHSNESQKARKRPLKEIISENKGNTVILGQPGSGKTTSIKYIVNSVLRDSEFLNDIYTLPIVIRLRELNKSNSVLNESQQDGIFEKLSSIFGLNFGIKYIKERENKKKNILATINTTNEDNEKLNKLLKTKIIPYILDNQKILLILDGFDEIIDSKIKNLVVSEITELTKSLNSVNFILTSRSADYNLLLENTTVYEISELNESQIKEFSDKWFEDSNLSEKFRTELYAKTPYKDFYTRPLLLTQLALIYSRTSEIPDKPKMIYQRIVELVLKDWNEQHNNINRKTKYSTKYSTFTAERKREFLSNMAFNLKVKHNRQVFSKNELSVVYGEINNKFKELPPNEVEDVIAEIETHNGLFIKSGYDSFEFSHLTIQEYFVADYIIRSGSIGRIKNSYLQDIPNELAIVVALSSEPSIFFYDLLVNIMLEGDRGVNLDFLNKFFNRIRLEKPDFEINSDTVQIIALLSIYSKKINTDFSSHNALNSIHLLKKFIVELFGNNIERFLNGYYVRKNIGEKFLKNDVGRILNGYCKVTQSNDLLVFRKLDSVNRSISNNDFPEILYWIAN